MYRSLNLNESYTFSKFFELKIIPRNLALAFDYQFERRKLALPQYAGDLPELSHTQSRIENILPYVTLASEASRREVLIAPVIMDLVLYTKAELQIECPLKVNQQLQGILDYFLESKQHFLIVEAKREDLDFGMTQLLAELIALDYWLAEKDQPQQLLLGAVTTGKVWEFARLNRQKKSITQGLETYSVPDNIEKLMRVLVQALV